MSCFTFLQSRRGNEVRFARTLRRPSSWVIFACGLKLCAVLAPSRFAETVGKRDSLGTHAGFAPVCVRCAVF